MTGRTYSVVRNHWDREASWDRIVESGLDFETAKARADELDRAECAAHPELTTWTRDTFWVLLEDTDRHKKLLKGAVAPCPTTTL